MKMPGIDLRRAPVIRVLVPFACGVWLGEGSGISAVPSWGVPLMAALWTFMGFFYIRSRRSHPFSSLLYCIVAAIFFLACGFWNGVYTRPSDPRWPAGEDVWLRIEVQSPPEKVNGQWRLAGRPDLLWNGFSCREVNGSLRIYCGTAEGCLPRPGDICVFFGRLYPVRNSGNPGDVDYESMMQRQDCWYRLYSQACWILQDTLGYKRSWQSKALDIRERLSSAWTGERESVELLRAVCLGDRSGLGRELEKSYAGAGGMHLLAVSGLHIGFIWGVLHFGFFWMAGPGRGEWWRGSFILVILWGYAFMTGFSSSVCRSVTMCSFFTLGRIIGRKSYPLNAILVSALFLLLISPQRLFDVGFQLSYSAILGIALLFPVLRGILRPPSLLLRWIWDASCVSFSAQVSTVLLVIHYFHQVPVYSLITSLWAIPVLSVLIVLFVVSVPVALTGVPVQLIHRAMTGLAGLMNRGMELMARLPGSVAGDLQLDGPLLILWMFLLWTGIGFLQQRSRVTGMIWMVIVALICLQGGCSGAMTREERGLMIPHFFGGSQVSIWMGRRADHYRWCTEPDTDNRMDQHRDRMWNPRQYQQLVAFPDSSSACRGRISACREISDGIWLVGNDQVKCLVIRGGPEDISPEILRCLAECRVPSGPGCFDLVLLTGGDGEIPAGPLRDLTNCTVVLDGSNRRGYPGTKSDPGTKSGPGTTIHSTYHRGAFLKRW